MSSEEYVSAQYSGLINGGRLLRIYNRARSKRSRNDYLVTLLLSEILSETYRSPKEPQCESDWDGRDSRAALQFPRSTWNTNRSTDAGAYCSDATVGRAEIERRTTLDGFDFFGFMGALIAEEQVVRSKTEIVGMLSANGDKFADCWRDCRKISWASALFIHRDDAAKQIPIRDADESVKEHEMHHRGQLMLIERMLGIVPP
jgi:hypothetical protein